MRRPFPSRSQTRARRSPLAFALRFCLATCHSSLVTTLRLVTRHPSIVTVLLLVTCHSSLVTAAWAQGLFVLGKREGFVEFGYEGDRQTSATNRVRDFASRQRLFDERVGLRGDMYILDRSLVTLNYGANFGFLQDRFSANGDILPERGRLIGYDMGGSVLPQKDLTSSWFASRADNIDTREFVGLTETISKDQGATVLFKKFFLPSTVSYRQEFSQEQSRFGDLLGLREDSRNIVSYDGQRRWTAHDVTAHYEFADLQDHVQPTFSFGSHTANFNDRFKFGEDVPKLLNSRLYYLRRGGRLEFSSINLQEDLRITHTPSLSSGYLYTFSHSNGSGSSTTTHTAVASLSHRLYESLSSGVSLQGGLNGFPNGGQRIMAARADTNYQKKLPRHGRLVAGLGGLYEISDNHFQGREIPVFQERHTARIGIPFRLDQFQAIPDSLLISAETGTIFLEDLDFIVRVLGNFTEIDILPSGRIRDGEILFIDYQVSVSPSLLYSTKSAVIRIGPDYGWVNPYYSYERLLQNLLSGTAEAPLENLRAHTAGIRFRWTGARFSGNFTNEYRNQDSFLLPYKSLQFSQFISYNPRRSFTLGLSLDETLYHFRIPERRTTSGSGCFSVGWRPWSSLIIEAFVSGRVWRDTIAANETFRDAGMRLKLYAGKFTFASSFNANLRQRNGNLTQDFRWVADINRRF